ncbi:MAG TPA: rhomboid family intramembrane serine protease [Verrucomicrobiae bacterium]|nr:rhomboid family intramembrane serine protease [Verrucomicrobiae bacterium]
MIEDRYYMRQSTFDSRRSATIYLLIANVVAFLVECFRYGFPPHLFGSDHFALSWNGLKHGYVWELLTFQFMHANLFHLLVNCWTIYVFGREVEIALGIRRFLILYFGSGVIGGLLQAGFGSLSEVFPHSSWARAFLAPTVGASAGGLGLVAAYATLFPERMLTLLLFFIVPVNMRAKFLLLFTALISIFGILFPSNMGAVADAAHLGGMIAGIFFIRYAMNWTLRLPSLRRGREEPSRRLVRVSSSSSAKWARAKRVSESEAPADDFLSREVDPILDKISAHGIQSLTERERRILETARQRMGKR